MMNWQRSTHCEANGCLEVAVEYRTSSHCEGGACLEVGADWAKSSRSTSNGNCVEARRPDPEVVYVRDSKDPDGPVLRFDADEWRAFVAGIRGGEFDL